MIEEKRWDKNLENPIIQEWKKQKKYTFQKNNTNKPIYSIDTPPPYVNLPIHIGQATTYCMMDIIARYKRMKGHNIIFPLGLDNNGIPIEQATEKKFNINILNTPREQFIKKAKQLLQEAGKQSEQSLLRLGICFNSWEKGNEIGEKYETDSEEYRTLTQKIFLNLWNQGLIYEDERICNYCPGCQTPIADAEIDYKEVNSNFNKIKFKIKENNQEITIGTTRPELIAACGMIIYNPKDDRYKKLEGKTAITPIYNKQIPIKPHPQAEINKGTGLVMMCSAGDLADIRFFREQKLTPTILINKNGKMNKHSGPLKDLTVKEARKKIIQLLEQQNLLVEKAQILQRSPICERSKDDIEFILLKSLYLKQKEYQTQLLKIGKKINFLLPQNREIYDNWVQGIAIDWPITRNRYYATEVPLWKCKDCNEFLAPPPTKYYQPWKEKPPSNCKKCDSSNLEGDPRVLDTWFDSSNSPLYVLKYGTEFFKKAKPCSLRPQGKEIIRTWLYYTVLKGLLLNNEPIFETTLINQHILDDKGRKMSKSLGNVIDPQKLIEKYGAESMRLWSVLEGNLIKKDMPCSTDKIENASKTLIKLWNVARFVTMFEQTKETPKILEVDTWITNETHNLIKEVEKHYEEYNFHEAVQKIKHFLWETFASHYIELVKSRAYNENNQYTQNEKNGAIQTLNTTLKIILKLLAPINPIITYKLYNHLENKDIHFENFPTPQKEKPIKFTTTELETLNSLIWKTKKDSGISLKQPIKQLQLTENFKTIEKELKLLHNPEQITYGKEIKITK